MIPTNIPKQVPGEKLIGRVTKYITDGQSAASANGEAPGLLFANSTSYWDEEVIGKELAKIYKNGSTIPDQIPEDGNFLTPFNMKPFTDEDSDPPDPYLSNETCAAVVVTSGQPDAGVGGRADAPISEEPV